MTLAADILTDLETMMEDWSDTGSFNGGASINILFDNEYVVIEGADVGSAKPAALCRTTDVAGAKKNDTLVVTSVLCNMAAVSYTVLEAQKNPMDGGPGTTRLILKKT